VSYVGQCLGKRIVNVSSNDVMIFRAFEEDGTSLSGMTARPFIRNKPPEPMKREVEV
jgi:hypothetical protein